MSVEKCGCRARAGYLEDGGVDFCPLHAAAEEMRAALKVMLRESDDGRPTPCTDVRVWQAARKAAKLALAQRKKKVDAIGKAKEIQRQIEAKPSFFPPEGQRGRVERG